MFKYWYLSILLLVSIFTYLSVFIAPTLFWPAIFVSYAIPGFLILNLILLFAMLLFRRRLVVFPLINLLIGLPFVLITLSFKGEKASKIHEISILSFNAKFFRNLKSYDKFSFDMIKWAAIDTSDIKCLQVIVRYIFVTH